MPDTDIIPKKELKNPTPIGVVGTNISDRFYDEDYLQKFNNFKERAEIYEKMSVLPVIAGLLKAVRNPILSSKWAITFESEEKQTDSQKKHIEYLNQVIFIDNKFMEFKLFEILTIVQHGYSFFEKVFKLKNTKDLGDYLSVDIQIRKQKSINSFLFKENSDEIKFVIQSIFNSGINRNLNGVGEVELPIEKLLTFTLDQVGNDITGEAMLRGVYRSYNQIDFSERMQMVAIEKMALGTPVVTSKEPINEEDLEALKIQLRKYIGSQMTGVILPPNCEMDIKSSQTNHDAILKVIQQKNTEMTVAFLAQFLLLGQQGSGGAYALGQDQSDFFLNSLEYIGKLISHGFSDLIKQLIDFQFGKQDVYPVLKVKGINNKASKELADTLKTLSETGLIIVDDRLQKFISNTYGLPNPIEGKANNQPQETKDQEKKNETKVIENSNQFSQKIKLQDFVFKENVYVKSITDNEDFIQDFFNDKYMPVVDQHNEKIKSILSKGYDKAKTEIIGGVEYLAQSGNLKLMNEMISEVKAQYKKLENKLLSPPFADKIMNQAQKNGNEAVSEILTIKLSTFFVQTSELNAFKAGHISNMRAVFFNESRRTFETINTNFGNRLPKTVIQDQVKVTKMNQNTLKLSVTAHPRAVFRGEVLRGAQSQGINNFKSVTPKGIKLNPEGKTIRWLWRILPLFSWEEINEDSQNAGGVVGGLGLHHNSQEYYLPIADNELKDAQELSKEQRKNLDSIKKQDV